MKLRRLPAIYKEPCWNCRAQLQINLIPKHILACLLDPTSLTARIVEHCPGTFGVQLLEQRKQRPLASEARQLGMRRYQQATIRHVYLMCNDRPWVFARTVIPHRTERTHRLRLGKLGSQSLGSLLFSDRSVRRGEVQIADLRTGHKLYTLASQALADKPHQLWARRSLFWLKDKPLLVNEIFLPAYRSPGC